LTLVRSRPTSGRCPSLIFVKEFTISDVSNIGTS
jgi:hypothetical protein